MAISDDLARSLKSMLDTTVVLTHKTEGGAYMVDNPIHPFVEGQGSNEGKRFCLYSKLGFSFSYEKPIIEVRKRLLREEGDMDEMIEVKDVDQFISLMQAGDKVKANNVTPITAARKERH